MVTIRRAAIDDLDSIRKLNKDIFYNNPNYDEDIVDDFASTPQGTKYFKEAITNKDGCFLLAEKNGKLVGYANGGAMDVSYRKSKYFEIDNLGVIQEIKRKGTGKQLLKEITKYAKKAGYQKIYLNSYAKNKEALDFYKACGYSEIDVCLEKKIE